MNITEILRERRIELGISQNTLGKYLGYTGKATVSRFEIGSRRWKLEDFLKACELLKLEIKIIKLD